MNANKTPANRRILSAVLALLLVVGLLPVVSFADGETATSGNLIANGDFSQGTTWTGGDTVPGPAAYTEGKNGKATGWDAYSNSLSQADDRATLIIHPDAGIGGSPCLQINLPGTDTAGGGLMYKTNYRVEIGKTYVVSFWAKTTNTAIKPSWMAKTMVTVKADDNKYIGNQELAEADKWEYISYEFTPEPADLTNFGGDTDWTNFALRLTNIYTATAGSLYIDNVSFAEKAAATEITMPETPVSVTIGNTIKLNPTVTPANTTDTITWSSDAEAVATVDAFGNVTAVSGGTAKITAKISDELSVTRTVYVVTGGGNLLIGGDLEDATAYTDDDTVIGKSITVNGTLPTGWTTYPYVADSSTGNIYVCEDALGNTGKCLRLQTNGDNAQIGVKIPTDYMAYQAGETKYKLTYRVYVAPNDDTTSLTIFTNARKENKNGSEEISTMNQWVDASVTFKIAEKVNQTSKKAVWLYLGSATFNGNVYFDDFKLEITSNVYSPSGSILNVDETLRTKFAIPKASLPEDTSKLSLQITHLGSDKEPVNYPFKEWTDYNADYYAVTSPYQVYATQMTERFEAVILNNGVPYNTVWTDSVLDYCNRGYADLADAATDLEKKEKELMLDVLHYGAAAEKHFKGSSAFNASTIGATTVNSFTAIADETAMQWTNATNNYIGANMSLQESVALSFWFNMDYAEGMTADVTMDSQVVQTITEFRTDKDGYCAVKVTKAGADDLDELITVTVKDRDGDIVAEATDSMAKYLARAIAANEDDAIYNAVGEYCASVAAYVALK